MTVYRDPETRKLIEQLHKEDAARAKLATDAGADLLPIEDELGAAFAKLVVRYGERRVRVEANHFLKSRKGKQRSVMNERVDALIVKAIKLGFANNRIAECIATGWDVGVDGAGNEFKNYWIPREGDPLKTAKGRVHDVIRDEGLAEARPQERDWKITLSPSQLIFTPLAESVPRRAHRAAKSKSVTPPSRRASVRT
jgi:hypothetical protein